MGIDRPHRRPDGVPVPRGAERIPDAVARAARRAARRLVRLEPARDLFDEIELREDVRQLLRGLAPRQRAALLLLDMFGYGSEEAARIMGIRRSTVRALAAQGRAVLRTKGESA